MIENTSVPRRDRKIGNFAASVPTLPIEVQCVVWVVVCVCLCDCAKREGKFRECFRSRRHCRLIPYGQHSSVRPLAGWLLLLLLLPEKERPLCVCPPEVDEGTIYRASQSTL